MAPTCVGAFSLPDIERKSFQIKAIGEAEGTVEAVISTFGVVDRDGDIMLAAAFAGSNGKSIPMVWSHNWDHPVGKGTVTTTPTEAVYHGQFFLDTERGQEAFKTVRAMGSLQEYSIGFRILEATDEKTDNTWVRKIKDIELFEASPVLVGAAYGTRTLAVKQLDGSTLAAAGALIEAIENAAEALEALLGIEDDLPGEPGYELMAARRDAVITKVGATMSAPNLHQLHAAKSAIDAVHGAACKAGADCPLMTKDDTGGGDSGDKAAAAYEIEAAVVEVGRMLAHARGGNR